jgi:hypothetical protein
MSLVTIANVLTDGEALIARSRLEAAGFHPLVSGYFRLTAGGKRVQVPQEEAADAIALLSAPPQPNDLPKE